MFSQYRASLHFILRPVSLFIPSKDWLTYPNILTIIWTTNKLCNIHKVLVIFLSIIVCIFIQLIGRPYSSQLLDKSSNRFFECSCIVLGKNNNLMLEVSHFPTGWPFGTLFWDSIFKKNNTFSTYHFVGNTFLRGSCYRVYSLQHKILETSFCKY